MLTPLYKNNQLIAFNKPAGVPLQPDPTGDASLQQQGEAYCQHPLFIIHRLDRPVSGVVLFAKTKNAIKGINEQFRVRSVEKTYLAVVAEKPPAESGVLVHYLQKNAEKNRAYASDEERPNTDRAELKYRILGSSDRYHLLEVNLITGRHHQVRAQLSAIGCPVKGDVKYGARRSNADRSIHLHAWKLMFNHPVSGERLTIEAPLPAGDPVWNAFMSVIDPERAEMAQGDH